MNISWVLGGRSTQVSAGENRKHKKLLSAFATEWPKVAYNFACWLKRRNPFMQNCMLQCCTMAGNAVYVFSSLKTWNFFF
jgi:hypothetical protein